ncbi:hypothetical protein PR003_g11027 [Phytophthora rubi]|uniref:DDE Tnp4 domain-containing protein n=1 Tax=Phytophthora rubi TaxID=129364 RepID=A0A6A3MLH7_9STRA|nr:hypothetical protein PR002_g8538 [Phytophthora rubi]KAE9037939.1 hypothetical protein PR001_g8173 [Phytophthora rubi]KAE9339402.1 hypothetical protein PR003_g11027 [Phytophthora rubi]
MSQRATPGGGAPEPSVSRRHRALRAARTPEQVRLHVEGVLAQMNESQITREQELSRFPTTRLHEGDTELTATPFFDEFRDVGGSAAIKETTNFTLREFNELWLSVRDYVVVNYNVGRGKRSEVSGNDAFFMTHVTLKAGGTWEGLCKVFNIASATFTDTVTKFIRLLSPKLYADQVQAQADRTQMRTAMTSGHAFSNFPCALYAVDVTFQQSFCPGGPIQENGKYYSGKHHLYGLKVEVSVNTHGFAINCSDHAKGATHDVSMFKDNKPFHLGRMLKLPGDESLQDNGPMSDKYPE